MDSRKLASLCLITLFLLCAGCVGGTDNQVDRPTATMVQVTTPVSSPTPAAVNSDMITGTWVCHSRYNQDVITLVFSSDGTFTRHDSLDGANYKGTWKLDSPNKYMITYQEPTPTETADVLTYNPDMKRLYRDTLEYFEKTGN